MNQIRTFMILASSMLLSSCLAELEIREVQLDGSMEDMLPVEEDMLPIEEDMLPVEEDMMPVEADMMPVEEDMMPVEEDMMPVEADMMPVEEDMMPVEADMMPVVEDMMPVEEDMMPVEADMEPICEPSYELCDGLDNDCDGTIDEAHWAVNEITPGMLLTFSETTNLEGASLIITSFLTNGQLSVDVVTDDSLAMNLSLDLPDAEKIQIAVNATSEQANWFYEIDHISDLSSESRVLPPPYPSVGVNDLNADETRSYVLSNNIAEGVICPNSCPRVTSVCENGEVYCPIDEPIEACDNIDNDCDGNIDENLVALCSEPERGGMLGVCGEIQSICNAGEWSSCDYEDLKTSGLLGSDLISDMELCDCYDNNCNGIVDEPAEYGPTHIEADIDWTLNDCIPDLSFFQAQMPIPPECHIRPRYDQNNGNRRQEPIQDLTGTVYLGSLHFHENSRLWIVNPNQGSDGRFTANPGYTSASIPSNCVSSRKVKVGGDLTIIANQISIPTGSELSVTTEIGTCDTGSSNPYYHALSGGSGGNLRLLANEINIQGTLSANGSAPNNASASFSNYSAGSGGAAGSIFMISPNLNLNNALISARGGRGVCDNDHTRLCDNSSFFGGGPGSTGGGFYGQHQGTGSGGPTFDQVNPERNIRIIGGLTTGSSARIRAQNGSIAANGEGECDGHMVLSGGTLNLDSMIACGSSKPDTFITHQLSLMPLGPQGKPIASDLVSLEVYTLIGDTLVEASGALGQKGALTLRVSQQSENSAVSPGSTYKLVISNQDSSLEIASVLMLKQSLGQAYQSQTLIPDTNGEMIFIVP